MKKHIWVVDYSSYSKRRTPDKMNLFVGSDIGRCISYIKSLPIYAKNKCKRKQNIRWMFFKTEARLYIYKTGYFVISRRTVDREGSLGKSL